MKNSFEEKIVKLIKSKFGIEPKSLLLLGTFNLEKYSHEDIDKAIKENIDDVIKLKRMFAETMCNQEVMLFKIGENDYVTVYDSSELWQDPLPVSLYSNKN